MLKVAGGRVGAGGEDGGFIELDANERVELWSAGNGKEPYAAVGVDEMPDAAVGEASADGARQFGQEVKVVLEEGIVGNLPGVGGNPERDFQSSFGGRRFSDFEQLPVQGGFSNGAVLDIDDEAVVVAEVAEDEPLFGSVPLGAHHDAVAVAIGRGARDGRLDGRIGKATQPTE